MEGQYFEGVGRRKTATARVRIYPSAGDSVIINNKPAEEYFPRETDKEHLVQPLKVAGVFGAMSVSAHVDGGGVAGQLDAVRLGIARALLKFNGELRTALKEKGFLTRDARAKERKKPGLKRARKAPQYTKR